MYILNFAIHIYFQNFQMIDLLTWQSELVISNVTSPDYGGYECTARNSEGTTRYTVDLDVKSRPGKLKGPPKVIEIR